MALLPDISVCKNGISLLIHIGNYILTKFWHYHLRFDTGISLLSTTVLHHSSSIPHQSLIQYLLELLPVAIPTIYILNFAVVSIFHMKPLAIVMACIPSNGMVSCYRSQGSLVTHFDTSTSLSVVKVCLSQPVYSMEGSPF